MEGARVALGVVDSVVDSIAGAVDTVGDGVADAVADAVANAVEVRLEAAESVLDLGVIGGRHVFEVGDAVEKGGELGGIDRGVCEVDVENVEVVVCDTREAGNEHADDAGKGENEWQSHAEVAADTHGGQAVMADGFGVSVLLSKVWCSW